MSAGEPHGFRRQVKNNQLSKFVKIQKTILLAATRFPCYRYQALSSMNMQKRCLHVLVNCSSADKLNDGNEGIHVETRKPNNEEFRSEVSSFV